MKNITSTKFFCTIFLLLGIFSTQAQIVTSSADDGGAGTLRNQVAIANDGAIITFALGVDNIVLTNGEIVINNSITITGNLITNTIIDGNDNGRVFNITSGDVIINDLEITNGTAADGGAIMITDASLTLTGSTVSNSVANGVAGSGGGIFVGTGGSLTVVTSSITGNQANRAGGGIELVAGADLTLTDVNLDNNNAGVAPATAAPGNGGGLHITGAADAIIIGGTVSNNTAASEGGGLWNGAGTMDITGTTIDNNTASGPGADNGGGGVFNLSGTLSISNATISNNDADGAAGSGGGIFNDVGATLEVTDSSVTNNTANRAGGGIEVNSGAAAIVNLTNVNLNSNTVFAFPGNGGGLHVTGDGTVNIEGGTVNNNTAAAEGGGLWNGSGTMTITGATIDANTASGADADQGGGGIYNLNGGTLVVETTTISNNIANGTLGSGGGILNDVGSNLSITDTTISGNTAVRAGGGIEDNSGTSTITLENVNVENNTVSGPPGNGGGIHVTGGGNVTMNDGTVNGNTAAQEGGGLWNGTGTMTITGTTINGNTASGADADQGGGGIYNLNGGTLVIEGATITNNIANGTLGSGGGILNDVGSQLSITDTTITGNTAVRAGGGIEDNSGTSTIILTSVTLSTNTVSGPPGNGGGLHITGGGSVTITDSTINGNSAAQEGGGLWNGTGTMTVTGTVINANIAAGAAADDGGAGIFNNGGTLNLNDTTISNNLANGTSGSGGGIFSIDGAVTIDLSFIENNSANRAGGAIEIVAGTLAMTNSDMASNDVNGGAGTANPGNGGGLHVTGIATTTLTSVTISENEAAREGGGLWNQTGSTMTVTNSTIDSNTATGVGADNGGGGIFVNGGTLNVNSSTISSNTNVGVGVGNGGGIHIKAGEAIINVSTISGNQSVHNGGGIYNNAMLTLNSCTIVENIANPLSAGIGGGISVGPAATSTSVKNTIVANNDAASGIDVSAGTYTSNGFNLIGQDDLTTFTSVASDLEGTEALPINPLIAPLANNGGTTLTHALLAGSPAYNAGDPADLYNDQTGAAVFGGVRDIGAFEAQTVLGINETTFNNSSKSIIYPNPANNVVNIKLATGFGLNVNARMIELASGKTVREFKFNGNTNEVNISGFASGIYAIQLTSENVTETHKLIIE